MSSCKEMFTLYNYLMTNTYIGIIKNLQSKNYVILHIILNRSVPAVASTAVKFVSNHTTSRRKPDLMVLLWSEFLGVQVLIPSVFAGLCKTSSSQVLNYLKLWDSPTQ